MICEGGCNANVRDLVSGKKTEVKTTGRSLEDRTTVKKTIVEGVRTKRETTISQASVQTVNRPTRYSCRRVRHPYLRDTKRTQETVVIPCDGIERRPILRPRFLHLFTGSDVDPFVEIDRQPNRLHRSLFDTRRNDTTVVVTVRIVKSYGNKGPHERGRLRSRELLRRASTKKLPGVPENTGTMTHLNAEPSF